MRLRYLHLSRYPPINDISIRFSSGSPLQRECAIRFVVGVNGSGKSNLLRGVAEVFLALADERLPPFPVSLIYELGQRGKSGHYTFVVDCPGSKTEASLWVSDGWHWPDEANADAFETAIRLIREGAAPEGFREFIRRGTWPQSASIALPKAVLAYTTGDLRPWRSIWNRNQDAEGLTTGIGDETYDPNEERPAGWSIGQESAIQPANREEDAKADADAAGSPAQPSSDVFRRPILLNPTLLKCALLAVALPQAFVEAADYPQMVEVDALMAKLRSRTDNKTSLQELLERGGWHQLVSVGLRCRLQPKEWNRTLRETAHDWLLCAGEVIADPHPTESRRTLYFDLKGRFRGQDVATLMPYDGLSNSTTQGEALWSLLGGHNSTAFELFAKLMELNQTGLFDEVELRLRRQARPAPGSGASDQDKDIGVLRYEELSDGEQMVLGRMALFHLLKGQQDALLLLDEPETHFNDKWKREIVDIIDEAIGLTANDVLISTHSAIVLTDVFNDEIVLMERSDGAVVARTVDSNTFASDPSELIIRIFGADDSVGQRAREYIEDLLHQAQGSPDDIRRLKALVERLGSGFYRSELRTLLNQWERNA